MSKGEKESKKRDRVEKKEKKHKSGESKRKRKDEAHAKMAKAAFSLLADEKTVDPTLSSLFAVKPTPPIRAPQISTHSFEPEATGELEAGDDEELSEIEADDNDHADSGGADLQESHVGPEPSAEPAEPVIQEEEHKRKRKRKDDAEEIEDVYMRRLEREQAKDAEGDGDGATKRTKKPKTEQNSLAEGRDEGSESGDEGQGHDHVSEVEDEDGEEVASPPPRHETQEAADAELSKANRTVFLGNVSIAAITSKSARKELMDHLQSFFKTAPHAKPGEPKHSIESIRFRSTAYATPIPKKASFARKELMDATTHSTNAYVVYSSPSLAREATKLNGSIILNRHLRVDSVAHPAKVDNKRCVFVGNLGFVDDESNINAANKEEGKENRKPAKQPADVEEGLWRTFGKCGTVESVRVIRDSTTRVGKGIAYVQFENENGVEAALLLNEKKFPPLLPRKLRVSRAKAQKRNAKPGSGRPSAPKTGGNGYQRKVTGEEASQIGRTGKLFGRAAAAQVKGSGGNRTPVGIKTRDGRAVDGIKKPEAFVFEGHRASSTGGKAGLKLGKPGKKKGGKPTSRSAKRGAAFKAGKKGM